MSEKYSKGHRITNILHFKALQNIPKLGFWYENIPPGNPALSYKMFRRTKKPWN
jgi:hypothetical protein